MGFPCIKRTFLLVPIDLKLWFCKDPCAHATNAFPVFISRWFYNLFCFGSIIHTRRDCLVSAIPRERDRKNNCHQSPDMKSALGGYIWGLPPPFQPQNKKSHSMLSAPGRPTFHLRGLSVQRFKPEQRPPSSRSVPQYMSLEIREEWHFVVAKPHQQVKHELCSKSHTVHTKAKHLLEQIGRERRVPANLTQAPNLVHTHMKSAWTRIAA